MVFTVAGDSFTAVSVTVTVSFIHFIQNRQIKFGSRSSRFVTDAGVLSLVKPSDKEGLLTLRNVLGFIFWYCGSAMSPRNGAMEGGVSLSFSSLTVRRGMVCCCSVHSCPTQVPLCIRAHSEPPSCVGIMGKSWRINTERNLRVPVGRPVGFLPPSFDTVKLRNSNCDFYEASVWKNSRVDTQTFTEDFRVIIWNLLVSELLGLVQKALSGSIFAC